MLITMKKAASLLILWLAMALTGCVAAAPSLQGGTKPTSREGARSTFRAGEFTGVVTRVTDGDTLWVALPAGSVPVKLRIEGMDAPESCQAWGSEAREALAQRLNGRIITVKLRALDSYGRRLGKVFDGTDDVAAVMVAQGHAWSLGDEWRRGPYGVQEREAREARRGLHAATQTERPQAFRKRHGPCEWPGPRLNRP
jgi:micrococcal nuclease